MSNKENGELVEKDEAGEPEVEEALKAIENIKQKFNFTRSQHFLSKAVHLEGLKDHASVKHHSDAAEAISQLKSDIDRLCIQEAALQYSLESDTIFRIRSSGVLSSKLQGLLDLQLKQEMQIVSMSSKISEEYSRLREAQANLTHTLEKYACHEKERAKQFQESSINEDKELIAKLRQNLKEIRFMQLIIPRIVSQSDDMIQKEWVRKLCHDVRNPILSVDDLQ